MKKIMITLAAVAFATVMQAATINWSSGALLDAGSDGSGWGSAKIAKSSTDYVMDVYIYSTYSGGQLSGLLGSGEKIGTTSKSVLSGSVTIDGSLSESTTYYLQAIVENSDNNSTVTSQIMAFTWNGGMENPKVELMTQTPGTGVATLSSVNGSFSNTTGWWDASGWVPAPEPTSGLLILIGMAGLALRRRRA